MPDKNAAENSLNDTELELQRVMQRAELVFDNASIEAAIDRLAQRLKTRLDGHAPLVLCVMQGGLMFTARLMPGLPLDAEFDYIHATRYRNTTQGNALEWVSYPKQKLEGRTVLVLDDILDEGLTLAAIVEHCREQGAKEVIAAVLLQKKHARKMPNISCEYVALEVDDRYVFGYGMDYKGKLRHLDEIYAVSS